MATTTKSAKNGKPTTAELTSELALVKDLCVSQHTQKKTAEARAAFLNWLRRVHGEVGCAQNLLKDEPLSGEFDAEEAADLGMVLSRVWDEMSGIEGYAVPTELVKIVA